MEENSPHYEHRLDAWQPAGEAVELAQGAAVVRLRLAQAGDVDALAAIELVSQPDPWSDEMFARELDLAWSRTWIVEDASDRVLEAGSGQALAFLVFWIVEDEAHVLSVATAPAARRKGVAKHLMSTLIDACEQRKIGGITLEVRAGNVGARALYSGLGFRKIGRRKAYYPDNDEDAIVMHRSVGG